MNRSDGDEVQNTRNMILHIRNVYTVYISLLFDNLCVIVVCAYSVPNSMGGCTPLGRTPVARIASLRGALSSDTVKRNLLDCMPPPPMEGGKCGDFV